MNSLLLIDSKFFERFNKAFDLVLLNMMWLICCVPIVTIGAATTALYHEMFGIVCHKEKGVFRGFAQSFRKDFLPSTIVWLAQLGTGILLYVDFSLMLKMESGMQKMLLIPLLCIAVIVGMTCTYIYLLIGITKDDFKTKVKNAFCIALANLPTSLLMVGISLLPVVLYVLLEDQMALLALADNFIAVSLVAFLNTKIMYRILVKYGMCEREVSKD